MASTGFSYRGEDWRALAEAMGSLMDNAAERRRLGGHALDVKDRFAIDAVMAMWNSVVGACDGPGFQRGCAKVCGLAGFLGSDLHDRSRVRRDRGAHGGHARASRAR
jgi:hypothetical protein